MFDWISSLVAKGSYLAIALLMLAENIFPPIPSEFIMPLAGFVASQGQLQLWLVILAGTSGSILGALPWYYAGKRLGKERVCAFAARHGRWIAMDEKDVSKAITWFEKHGRLAIFLGRLVPGVRTFISLPAGIARMPLVPFLLISALGTMLWTAGLALAGFLLKDQYEMVSNVVDKGSKILLSLLVLSYLFRVLAGGRLGTWVRDRAHQLRQDIHTLYYAGRDPRVPWYAKGFMVLLSVYVISPIDLIPDFIPLVGHLDDMILVPLGIWVALRLLPESVITECRQQACRAREPERDWRVGMLFIMVWIVVLLFTIRWLVKFFTGK